MDRGVKIIRDYRDQILPKTIRGLISLENSNTGYRIKRQIKGGTGRESSPRVKRKVSEERVRPGKRRDGRRPGVSWRVWRQISVPTTGSLWRPGISRVYVWPVLFHWLGPVLQKHTSGWPRLRHSYVLTPGERILDWRDGTERKVVEGVWGRTRSKGRTRVIKVDVPVAGRVPRTLNLLLFLVSTPLSLLPWESQLY